jgi:integrase
MPSQKITKRVVDSAQPNPLRRYVVMDAEVKGFGLLVLPSGVKSFFLQYRMGGRETTTQRYTIGKFGSPWTAETARDKAIKLRGKVADGVNICAQKRAAKNERQNAPEPNSVRRIFEQFEARYLRGRRSGAEVAALLKREVIARWGDRLVTDIRRTDLIELLDEIADRGTVYTRNRTAAHIRKMFNWAIGRGIEMINPAARIEMLQEETRDRVLTPEEIRLFWKGCNSLGYPFGSLFKMLLVTGQRRDEGATIDRKEVDKEAALWTIPEAKAKNGRTHTVPLSPLATSILSEQLDLGGFYFTTNGRAPVSGYSKAKARLDALMTKLLRADLETKGKPDPAATIQPWRLHDLRRTLSTNMAEMGVPPHIVEKILNHQTGSISGVALVYNRHQYLDERRLALNAWAERIIAIAENRTPASNVVALRA